MEEASEIKAQWKSVKQSANKYIRSIKIALEAAKCDNACSLLFESTGTRFHSAGSKLSLTSSRREEVSAKVLATRATSTLEAQEEELEFRRKKMIREMEQNKKELNAQEDMEIIILEQKRLQRQKETAALEAEWCTLNNDFLSDPMPITNPFTPFTVSLCNQLAVTSTSNIPSMGNLWLNASASSTTANTNPPLIDSSSPKKVYFTTNLVTSSTAGNPMYTSAIISSSGHSLPRPLTTSTNVSTGTCPTTKTETNPVTVSSRYNCQAPPDEDTTDLPERFRPLIETIIPNPSGNVLTPFGVLDQVASPINFLIRRDICSIGGPIWRTRARRQISLLGIFVEKQVPRAEAIM